MTDIYGPNTAEVEAFLAKLPALTEQQWDAARYAARDAVWDATWDVAWDAVWDAARDAALGAQWVACGLAVRDLISEEHFSILTAPMRAAGITFDRIARKN